MLEQCQEDVGEKGWEKARHLGEQGGFSCISGKEKRWWALQLGSKESEGLQRKGKVLGGLAKALSGAAEERGLMHFQEVFREESDKRRLSAEPAGCGLSEQRWVRREIADPSDNLLPLRRFFSPGSQEHLVPPPDGSPRSPLVPTALPPPVNTAVGSLALLGQSLGTSPTATANGEGAEEGAMVQDCNLQGKMEF